MYNIRNSVTLIGRVASEPMIIPNKDGSKKLFGKVAVQDNYKTDGKYCTEFIEFTMFVNKGTSNWAENLEVGDCVAVEGHLTCKPYVKDGQTVYPALSLAAEKVTPLARAAVNRKNGKKNND